MTGRLKPRETLALYGVIFASSFFFFLLGVFVGREYLAEAGSGPQPVASTDPGSDEGGKPQLDFYSELMGPAADQDEVISPQAGQDAEPLSDPTPPDEPGSQVAEASPDVPQAGAEPGGSSEVSESGATPSASASPPPSLPFFTVQVGALNTMEEATQVVLRLEAKGYLGKVIVPQPDNRFYRVWVGEEKTQGEALGLARRLKEEGFNTYVRRVVHAPSTN